jgi:exodeoxyribonuclease VII large subunit
MRPSPAAPLTPTQLVQQARATLEAGIGLVLIEGELSNVVRAASGHVYFSLKDANAQVRCAMFKLRAGYLKFKPADGMQVLARARVTLYEPRGEFQLVVESLEDWGAGRAQLALAELKRKLADEGLLDPSRKRVLPPFPQHLGVITSPTGAAIQDVLSVLRRRYRLLQVTVYPAQVQGANAASELRDALRQADSIGAHDVLLVTRGGGSSEDLSAFNDEALVRAIAACRAPVVSAVGHEIDLTLSDLAADMRAATPSAAAELIAPDQEALLASLKLASSRIELAQARRLERDAQRLDEAVLKLKLAHPLEHVERIRVRIGELKRRLGDPRLKLAQLAQRHSQAASRLERTLRLKLERLNARQHTATARLHAFAPLATLKRGYAIALDANGQTVTRAAALTPGDRLELVIAEGRVPVRVESD